MANKPIPTPDELRQLLTYDPATGKLFWKERRPGIMPTSVMRPDDKKCAIWNGKNAGREAFTSTVNGGYKVGYIFGVKMYAHRVIWAIENGNWPNAQTDHVDGDRSNNRIGNLRDVSATANSRNHKIQSNNSSGVVGISWNRQKKQWAAYIGLNYRRKMLGYFDSFEDAVAARKRAEVRHGFHKNHGRPAP